MCGLNLVIGEDNVERMNNILGHRGIRSSYTELIGDIFLGHVRLPIQGTGEEFDHPLKYKNYIGVMVGEIFNYKQIDPSAETDLIVVLQEFAKYGIEAFKQFDGFWTVIIFDTETLELHLITDSLAKKPLYCRKDTFAYSSEMKALYDLGPLTYNKRNLSAVKKWGYDPVGDTPFNEISLIPPFYHIVYAPIGNQMQPVLQYEYDKLEPKETDILEALRTSVRNRTVSDVPISLLLSGGLDSTIIYSLLKEVHKDPITIFHIENQESEYLKYVDISPEDKLIKLNLQKYVGITSKALMTNESPSDMGSVNLQYLLGEAIKEHGFNVCISGDGADELFGGYKRAKEYDSQHSDIFDELVCYHLPRLDKAMMAHTIELRSPFLARRVIEGALTLPYTSRKNKEYLKLIAEINGLAPRKIIHREKKPLRGELFNKLHLENLFKDLIKGRLRNEC